MLQIISTEARQGTQYQGQITQFEAVQDNLKYKPFDNSSNQTTVNKGTKTQR